AIIGLGYVGLPLAMEFAKHFPVVGYDIDLKRINKLRMGIDSTMEVGSERIENIQVTINPMVENLFHRLSTFNKEGFEAKDSLENANELEDLRKKGLYLTSNVHDISEANIFIVTVPTPINKYNSPNLRPLQNATK